MKYIFKYKKGFFWKKIEVVGHKILNDLDRADLFFEDGSIYSISQWSKCDLKLEKDWVLALKKQMEKESGKKID